MYESLQQQYQKYHVLIVACAVVLVLWMARGAVSVVTGVPLVAQVLQVLGLIYVAKLLMEGQKPDWATWPRWPVVGPTPAPTPNPATYTT